MAQMEDVTSPAPFSPLNARKERGSIAAQACETCRTRKQKCDEVRPKCGKCVQGKHECLYRDPLPTKKDKTLVELLALSQNMGAKVDVMYDMFTTRTPSGIPPIYAITETSSSGAPSSNLSNSSALSTAQPSPIDKLVKANAVQQQTRPGSPTHNLLLTTGNCDSAYYHHTAAHKTFSWPAFQKLPQVGNLPYSVSGKKHWDRAGSFFLLWVYRDTPDLSIAAHDQLGETPFHAMQSATTKTPSGETKGFTALTPTVMHELATAFFDSFNLLYFLLDREEFMGEMLPKAQMNGFHEDSTSTIVLLVLALGAVSIDAGDLHSAADDTAEQGARKEHNHDVPGSLLFNQARKRMGYCLERCELEQVQVFSLAALYYQAVFRYQDFWRLAATASNACYTLVTCNEIDWNSRRGEMTKRAFWHCAMVESHGRTLYLELGLPVHPLVNVDRDIGLPQFLLSTNEQDEEADRRGHWKHFYISQIALRRICLSVNRGISELIATSSDDSPHGVVRPAVLKYYSGQLTEWRRLLPKPLQWQDPDSPIGADGETFPHPDGIALVPVQHPEGATFTRPRPAPQTPVLVMPYVHDIQMAYLRTRYHQSHFIAHRPFIYKVLSFPEDVTQEDAEGAAMCLKSTVRWPIIYIPPVKYKRVIPYMCCWSQNFLAILLIYRASETDPMLHDIRLRLCGDSFEHDLATTRDLMLGWIRDLKGIDAMAAWCAGCLQGLYRMDA